MSPTGLVAAVAVGAVVAVAGWHYAPGSSADLTRSQASWLRQTCASMTARTYADDRSVPRSVLGMPLGAFTPSPTWTSLSILRENCS